MNRGRLVTICGVALLVGLMLAGTAVPGCASGEGKGGAVKDLTWVLQSYRDAGGETKTVPADVRVDAVFTAGEVSGLAGFNDYQGPDHISGDTMKNGPLVTTKKVGLASVMEIEHAYLADLESAATFTVVVEDESQSLVIEDTEGDAILAFTKEKPREFAGSSWELASLNNGTGGVVSVLEDTLVNITFDENGDLGGLAGCNSYWGTYAVEDDKLSIGPVDSTTLSCPEPLGVMEQEKAFLKALADAATFKIEGDTLELRADDGSLLASFDAWKLPPGG